MDAATISAIAAAIVAVLGAVTALVHSVSTRRQLNQHQAPDQHPAAASPPSPPSPQG